MTRRGLVIRLAAAAVAVAWVFMPVVAPAQSGGTATDPVVLNARITAEVVPAALANIQQLDTANRRSSIEYIVSGTEDARASFVDGEVDLIVSGIDLTDAQRAALQQSGRGVVSAPVQAAGLEVFGFVPEIGLFPTRCDEVDEQTGEPVFECSQADRIPLEADLRLGGESLVETFYVGSNIWNSASFVRDMGPVLPDGYRLIPPIRGARPLVRSDGDAFNQYLDAYVAIAAGPQRRAALAATPGSDPEDVPSESWPGFLTPSRQGMDNVVSTIASGLDPASSEVPLGGVIAAAATGAAAEAVALNEAKPPSERVPLFRAKVRNAAGEWLSPTPQSITAAVALDGGAPLAASTNPAKGAYPIAWVNRAYVPASGLTADEANAAASFIRLQVTAGQTRAAGLGDGRLTPAMVSEALAAADRIVESNCASAKGTVSTSADGTPWVPSGVLTGSPVKLCTGPATPEPTVPIDAGSGSEFDTEFDAGFSELGFDTGSSDVPAGFDELAAEVAGEQLDAGASVGGPVDAAASSGAAGSSSGATGTAVSRRMPLPIPGQTLPPLDRAVTLGLGALFAMVVWKLYERRTGFG
jgi:hypothetical protein